MRKRLLMVTVGSFCAAAHVASPGKPACPDGAGTSAATGSAESAGAGGR